MINRLTKIIAIMNALVYSRIVART